MRVVLIVALVLVWVTQLEAYFRGPLDAPDTSGAESLEGYPTLATLVSDED
ncbi:hypothetical protein [Methylobacterium sp. JK268]